MVHLKRSHTVPRESSKVDKFLHCYAHGKALERKHFTMTRDATLECFDSDR